MKPTLAILIRNHDILPTFDQRDLLHLSPRLQLAYKSPTKHVLDIAFKVEKTLKPARELRLDAG
jgi:hypothetical protein